MLSPDRSSSPGKQTARDDNLVLRRAGELSEEDRAFVLAVANRAFLVYGSYDTYLKDWYDNDAVSTILAEVDGQRAGFFMLTTYRDADAAQRIVADLVAIAVAPEFQSRGIGECLLAHAFSLAGNARVPAQEMWLVVAEGNARAQRFFARNGFRFGGGVGVYPAGQRALRMVRPLEVEW
jgi:ribosomal protein S18 acetylase RimI-like enzyme